MIDRIEEVQCMIAAIQHCHDRNADHPTRFQKNLSWFEYVAQMAESMAAELVVAKRLGYEYQPGNLFQLQLAFDQLIVGENKTAPFLMYLQLGKICTDEVTGHN